MRFVVVMFPAISVTASARTSSVVNASSPASARRLPINWSVGLRRAILDQLIAILPELLRLRKIRWTSALLGFDATGMLTTSSDQRLKSARRAGSIPRSSAMTMTGKGVARSAMRSNILFAVIDVFIDELTIATTLCWSRAIAFGVNAPELVYEVGVWTGGLL